MLSLRELMRVNHMREVHSFQIFTNGFLALCTVEGINLKVPVYDADGHLIHNTDTDPFGMNATYRDGVYVDIDVPAGKILRTDEISDPLYMNTTYNKYYALDFHGNILLPYTATPPIFNDVPQYPTEISDIPNHFTRLGPGRMANHTICLCQDNRFYQIPTQPDIVVNYRNELAQLVADRNLELDNFLYLSEYSTRLQAVHDVVAFDKDNFFRYAQIRSMTTKNYQIKEMMLKR